jgi:hypothetical protein
MLFSFDGREMALVVNEKHVVPAQANPIDGADVDGPLVRWLNVNFSECHTYWTSKRLI